MPPTDMKRLLELEDENSRLKKIVWIWRSTRRCYPREKYAQIRGPSFNVGCVFFHDFSRNILKS